MSSTGHLSELDLLRGQVADLSRQLAERDRSAQDVQKHSSLLRAIVEGTVAETGEMFFTAFVTQLTSTLHIKYAIIGEVQGDCIKKIRTLAVSAGGALVDNFEYELVHTPCATALAQTFAYFGRDLQATFPQFQRLADLGAESYCAVPLRTKGGAVIGLLAVMDTKPLEKSDDLQFLLGVFAPRIVAEFERKQAEQEKAQALADLHNVIETIPDIVFALDIQGNLIKWNRRLGDVTGYGPEELLNMPALAFVPPEEQTSTAAAIQRAFMEGYAELDGQLLTKDLRTIPYHWTGALLKNSHGEPIGITGIGRDVSGKRRAEEALRESEQRFSLAVEGANDTLWDAQRLPDEPWYAPQTLIWWSPRVRELLGLQESESFETFEQWAARLHPDDKDRVFGQLAAHMEHRAPYDVEYRLRTNAGDFRWIRGRGQAMWDEQGTPCRMSGSCQDITDRKLTEQALRESEERYRTLVDLSPNGVLVYSNNKKVYANQTACTILGYSSPEQLLESTIHHIAHPDVYESIRASIPQILATGKPVRRTERKYQGLDGASIVVEVDAGRIMWDGEPAIQLIFADITERKRVEESLRQNRALLLSFVEHTPAAIAMLDKDLKYVAVSKRWYHDYRLGDRDIIGLYHYDVFPEIKKMEHWQAIHRRCLAGEVLRNDEDRFCREDGREDWLRWEVRPWVDESGSVGGIIMFTEVITERKQAEETLRLREQELRTVLDALPVGVWFTDRSGQVLLSNPAAKRIWSNVKQIGLLTESNQVGWREDIGGIKAPHRWALTHALMRGVPSPNEALEFDCFDGTQKIIRNTTVPVRDEAGGIFGAIVLNEDITALRQAQEALKLTQFSVDRAVEGFFWISPEGWILNVNDAACRMLEYTREELTAMTVPDIDPNFPSEAWHAHWDELKQKGSLTFESKHWSKSGRVLDTEVTLNYLRYEGKEYNCAIMRDIGERKRAEEALRESETRLRAITDAVPGTVYQYQLSADGTQRFLFISRGIQALLGITSTEAVNDFLAVWARVLSEDAGDLWASIRQSAETLSPWHREFRIVHADGAIRWVMGDSIPESPRDDGSIVWNGILIDITERKQAEYESHEQAQRALAMQTALLQLARLDNKELTFAEGIEGVTEVASNTLAVERVSLWQLSDDRTEFVSLDVYEQSQACHSFGSRLSMVKYPRYLATIEDSLVMAVSDVLADSRTSELTEDYFLPLGITSTMDVPIRRHGKLTGVLCVEHVGPSREWCHDVQSFGASVGELVAHLLEIAERKRAEEELRQSEERYRFFVNNAPIGIFVNEAGRFAYANREFQRIVSAKTVEQLLGMPVLDRIAPEFHTVVQDRICQLMEHGQPVPSLDQQYLRLDGSRIDVAVTAIPTSFAGTPMMQVLVLDITERKKAEDDLRQSNAFLRQVLDINPNFIFAKDRDGRFTLANKAVADAYGTTVESLIGKTDADLNPNQEEVGFFRQKDLLVLDSLQDLFTPEEVCTDSTGKTRWLQTVKRPILDGEGKANMVLGASTDITERKHMEDELRQRERELQVALEERERISQDLHDGILQSLFAVGLTLESAKLAMPPKSRKTSGASLNQAIVQLNDVMREIRNFIAGLGTDLLQGKDLPMALQHMLASLTEHQAMRVRLAVEDRAAKALSTEQSLHLIRVIQEAVSNCIKHGHAREARVSLKMLKRGVRLSVRDNGRGFNQDAAKRTGHGLANMAARAQKIGGRFTILSKVNEGTSIVLDFPKEAADVSR